MSNELSVKEKIMHFAKQEFLYHGFKDASLRNIAAATGMTTGAIYTYFKDKNALFEAIVDPVCIQVKEIFDALSSSYYDTETVISDITIQKSLDNFYLIYDFIYKHFDVFRLLVVEADGSSKSDFVHTIVDYEVKHTLAYLDRMKKKNNLYVEIDCSTLHIISESYINALLEPVRHNMSHEEALKNLDFLVIFYSGGWQSVFNELFNEKK
ncbi:transcriptional regulator, TetR family [Alkaliphilus metalliredigens QYMF]|uniref:Transcriptional regulator, TetR family n=1 Tax=Alkaliphilus metalliredigens (strain QYMF) TaxID=293826 RepID=A6TUU8_ALKMQ|nr:TetR/AcrR family transcriptional regulator [Alkaliphilus metalliredigens]ABR49966.1 transcriptional regulator, TetR family [Alkaliphilus metalliredigens QYMF]